MNLTEFVRKNDIKCKDGEEFIHSPDFFKMKEFERTCHTINGVPFLEPETYRIKDFDVILTGFVKERWDKKEKKTKRRFTDENLISGENEIKKMSHKQSFTS